MYNLHILNALRPRAHTQRLELLNLFTHKAFEPFCGHVQVSLTLLHRSCAKTYEGIYPQECINKDKQAKINYTEFEWVNKYLSSNAIWYSPQSVMVALSLIARIWRKCLTIHSLPVLFFFSEVEIGSYILIPLFRPRSVHSGSAG